MYQHIKLIECRLRLPRRRSSSTTTTTTSASESSTSSATEKHGSAMDRAVAFVTDLPRKLYDNMGVLTFLGIAGGIITMIYRTMTETSNHTKVVDDVVETEVLTTEEVMDLIQANHQRAGAVSASLSADSFVALARSLPVAFPTERATYPAFVAHAQGYLDAPLKMGHYLDRVVLMRRADAKAVRLGDGTIERGERDPSTPSSSPDIFKAVDDDDLNDKEQDVRFFMILLALVLDSEYLEDHARGIFRALIGARHAAVSFSSAATKDDEADAESRNADSRLSLQEVESAVSFLVDACQVPSERLVIKDEPNLPYTQSYKVASAAELVSEAFAEMKKARNDDDSEPNTTNGFVSEADFVDLMFTKAICAWGSCLKRKF